MRRKFKPKIKPKRISQRIRAIHEEERRLYCVRTGWWPDEVELPQELPEYIDDLFEPLFEGIDWDKAAARVGRPHNKSRKLRQRYRAPQIKMYNRDKEK